MAVVLNPEKLLGFRIVGKVPGGKLGAKRLLGMSAKIGSKPGAKT